MQLNWIKCQGEVWCSLNNVNLAHAHFDNMAGVYIIWHGGPNASTVYVGQGNIRDRLTQHRSNPQIQYFKSLGLYVTWASVPESYRNPIEKYISDRLHPKVGELHPDVLPIEVNLPW